MSSDRFDMEYELAKDFVEELPEQITLEEFKEVTDRLVDLVDCWHLMTREEKEPRKLLMNYLCRRIEMHTLMSPTRH